MSQAKPTNQTMAPRERDKTLPATRHREYNKGKGKKTLSSQQIDCKTRKGNSQSNFLIVSQIQMLAYLSQCL